MHILSFAHHIPEQQKVSLHQFFRVPYYFPFLQVITWLTYYYNTILYILLFYTKLYHTTLHYIFIYTIYYIISDYTISYYTTLYYTLTMIFYTIEMYRVYIIWFFFSDKRRTNVYRRWTWAGTSCVVKGQ